MTLELTSDDSFKVARDGARAAARFNRWTMRPIATFGCLLLASLVSGCKPAQHQDVAGVGQPAKEWKAEVVTHSAEARAYKSDLVASVERAHRIVLVEHSSALDYVPGDFEASAPRPTLVYEAVPLSESQRKAFVASIRRIPDEMANWELACAFEAHHSFFFYSRTDLTSRMDVCFHCGEARWDGTTHAQPLNLTDGLANVVKAAGLSPERDWKKLLADSRAAAGGRSDNSSNVEPDGAPQPNR